MGSTASNSPLTTNGHNASTKKKRIFLNGFEMFTVGHISFGQWRNPKDRAKDQRRDLTYWTDLAKTLEKGGFTALFVADTFSPYDTYKGSSEPAIRVGAQWPIGDPVVPVTAMASVTKHLNFAITSSTSYEQPYVLAKRFSTLDHLTNGRFGWNIVTSFREAASKAVGLPYIEHDKRYEIADEYVRALYKLWEGSWADDALVEDAENGIYADFSKIRTIHHHGEKFNFDAPHILDPSPQRTPFLFQAGTSGAGIKFGSTHAEGIFVSGLSPHAIGPRVKVLRESAAAAGRDPQSIKIFSIFTPILGRTEEEAQAKYEEAKGYALYEGGLAMFSQVTGIDVSKIDPDHELTESDVTAEGRMHSAVNQLKYHGFDVPKLTPRNLGLIQSVVGTGPLVVGTAEHVADVMEQWIEIADLDGFNIGHIVSPGGFEDVVELLVPELRKRGRYPPPRTDEEEPLTFREQIYGKGQKHLRDDHPGHEYRYENYEEAVKDEGKSSKIDEHQNKKIKI